jgi:uncharacterized protein (DUF58 family)
MKIRPIILIVPLVLLAVGLIWELDLVLRLFFLSVIVLLLGYAWTIFGVRGLTAKVKNLPDHRQVGDEFDEEITVVNTNKLPKLLLTVEEKTDLPGYHNISVLNLAPGKSRSWQTTISCQRRGRYHLGSFAAKVSDPLGIFSRQSVLGEPHYVLIYPATVELPFFALSATANYEYGTGRRSTNQISPDASTVREFTSGDSLNHIHWRSTAHTGQLMVKVFDAERSRHGSKGTWIVLDMHQTASIGEGIETSEEYGVTIAASLVKKYLDEGMPVGLMTHGDRPYLFPSDQGEIHFRRMLEAFALMRATGQVTLDRLLSDEMERFKGDSSVIIITPSATEKLASAIWRLQRHGNSAVVVLLDAASFGGISASVPAARSLAAMGVPVYIVRKGDELAMALDSRVALSHTRFV